MLDELVGRRTVGPITFACEKPSRQGRDLRELVGLDLTPLDVRRAELYAERTAGNKRATSLRARCEEVPLVQAGAGRAGGDVGELADPRKGPRDYRGWPRTCVGPIASLCSSMSSRVTMEARRRITGKNGRRYSSDRIGVTGNAACNIVLRSAVFRGIPRAFWIDIYVAARKAAVGDAQTLASKRAHMFAHFLKLGATSESILAAINVQGEDDIWVDELATLKGIATAIKDGDTTVEEAFPTQPKAGAAPAGGAEEKKGVAGLAARVANAKGGAAAKAAEPAESAGGDGGEARS